MLATFDTHVFWAALTSGPYWRGALLALALTAAALAPRSSAASSSRSGGRAPPSAVRTFVFLYNWIFRATPTLLQLLFIWNALPCSGRVRRTWFTPFVAAYVALSLNEAAYMCEIIRAGLLSVDPGQELAGRALGMTRRRILRRVIVPQAIRIIIPPTGNEFITLLKLTSLASVISLQELLTAAEKLAAVKFQYIEALLAALVYYLVIVSILMVVQSRLERRFTWSSRRRRPRRVRRPSLRSHDAR